MSILLFIALNLLLMVTLFAVGVYQFMQVEEKRKRRKLLAGGDVSETELRELLRADRHDEALQRLMRAAEIDRFSAESTLEQLKERD